MIKINKVTEGQRASGLPLKRSQTTIPTSSKRRAMSTRGKKYTAGERRGDDGFLWWDFLVEVAMSLIGEQKLPVQWLTIHVRVNHLAGKKKTTKVKVEEEKPETVAEEVEKITEPKTRGKGLNKKWILGIVGLGILAVVGYNLKKFLVVATVNGQPIYRHEIVRELEKQGGKQVLDRKISEVLVMQEAAKQGVTISEGEIDDELKSLEDKVSGQGQSMDDLLAMQGLTREDLRQQMRMKLMIDQLIPESEPPTDEEIAQALEVQGDAFAAGATEDEKKQMVSDQLTQQKDSESYNNWMQSLQDQAVVLDGGIY
jgi:hypothetical protein